MRVGKGIIPVILSVMACAGAWGKADPGEPGKWSFGQYYQPYRATVEPNAPGYSLPLDVNEISNYEVDAALGLGAVWGLIEANGFAVMERDLSLGDPNRDSITACYEHLKARGIPLFVTTDTVLHLYHVQFDETLKDIEEREFITDLTNLTDALLTAMSWQYDALSGDLKEAARRNVAYLAVARRLISPTGSLTDGLTGFYAPALQAVAETVEAEMALIWAHEGFRESPLFIYGEDYSQYVPRGHYTRNQALGWYFKTMMWYGRMAFLLKGWVPGESNGEALISMRDADIQTLQALLLAIALQDTQVGVRTGLEVWDRLYGVTAFYVGLADDLTPYDYLWALDQVFQNAPTWSDLNDAANLLAIKRELALLPSPKIFGGTGDANVPPGAPPEYIYKILDMTKGMRLMGQRFIPDSYMFQHLVFPQVDEYTGRYPLSATLPFTRAPDGNRRLVRGYPRGLDVMALLGSERARRILIEEGDTDYLYFWDRFDELKTEFDGFDVAHWNQNLYWSWLYSLKVLLTDLPAGYPAFMRTSAWQRRSLNAVLASWTELRHDTILYAKQSYTPAGRGKDDPPPPPPAYIEPVPEFFGRLLALSRMTRTGLTDMQVLSAQAVQRLSSFETILARMLDIANEELGNQPLTKDDETYLHSLPAALETLVTGVASTGLKTTLVADVHTNSVEKMVLEEAVGKVDLIVVACPGAAGSVFLAAGPVLSYYEFKHPMADRLTDEAWRRMLDSAQKPGRQNWYRPLMYPSLAK
jgi:hypothetical protein